MITYYELTVYYDKYMALTTIIKRQSLFYINILHLTFISLSLSLSFLLFNFSSTGQSTQVCRRSGLGDRSRPVSLASLWSGRISSCGLTDMACENNRMEGRKWFAVIARRRRSQREKKRERGIQWNPAYRTPRPSTANTCDNITDDIILNVQNVSW